VSINSAAETLCELALAVGQLATTSQLAPAASGRKT
jgi:hypothetical protein